MDTVREYGYGLFFVDGVIFLETLEIEEKYDKEIEGSKELAKHQVDLRIEKAKEKGIILSLDVMGGYRFKLFGGRVEIYKSNYSPSLEIDGLSIKIPYGNDHFKLTDSLSESEVLGFLNIMSKLGVDAFLENYKKEIFELRDRLEIKLRTLEELYKIEGTIEKNAGTLANYWKDMKSFQFQAFHLALWMMPGIENEMIVEAYNKMEQTISMI